VFANCQMMGTDMGFPDVCMTPAAPSPIPVPYPNIAMGATAIPNCPTILIMAGPAHNLGTTIPMTNGDNAGVLLGVASGTVMGPSSSSLQNSTNCPGVRTVPSQTNVLLLAP
jgi:hypothetical protein